MAIREKLLGPDHPDVAHSLNNLAGVFLQLGQNDKALEYYRKSLRAVEAGLGPESPHVAYPLFGIGKVFVQQGLPAQALKPLERIVSICSAKNCSTETHGNGLFVLAKALVAKGTQIERAKQLAQQAQRLFDKSPAVHHEKREEIMKLQKFRKALERLRDKALSDYHVQINRHEQKELDDNIHSARARSILTQDEWR